MKNNLPPSHLVADSPEDLRILMIATNMKHGKKFHYFDFQFVRGKWYCWYEIAEKNKLEQDDNGDER
jgi:hypothetical protein